MQLLEDTLKKRYAELQQQGHSKEEIEKAFLSFDFYTAITKLTEKMSCDHIDFFEKTMYEKVLQKQAENDEFIARNSQIWGKGFVASEAMYILALEAGNDIHNYIATLTKEKMQDKMFHYYVLGELYGRACQQYSEIVYLIKGGFADGAFARWRSLFELSVIAEFIRHNDEEVAKAYYGTSFVDDAKLNWARFAPCFAGKKRITLEDIKKQCSMSTDAWNNQYRLANKVVHASAQGTFGRLGVPPNNRKFIPAGQSNYGLAMPAINAAISLSMIASDYFGFISSGDAIVYMRTLAKWANVVKEYYTDIEEKCFCFSGKTNDTLQVNNK